MNESCRLVGIAIGFGAGGTTNDLDIELTRYEVGPSFSGGGPTLQNFGNGSPLSSSDGGVMFVGLDDFDVPYWGNGHTFGPFFQNEGANPATSMELDHLAVSVVSGGGGNWDTGDVLHFIRFYYLE